MSAQDDLSHFAYRGARAMVLMHERALREFLATWRRARAADVPLPATDDPNYASLEHLLFHVLRAARGYLTWCCEVLELADPGVAPPPAVDAVATEADAYLVHLCERWRRSPLAAVEPARFDSVHRSRWGVEYCIDGMLEHAVLHPMRHAFQLEELLEGRA
jgi:hypothetical protein